MSLSFGSTSFLFLLVSVCGVYLSGLVCGNQQDKLGYWPLFKTGSPFVFCCTWSGKQVHKPEGSHLPVRALGLHVQLCLGVCGFWGFKLRSSCLVVSALLTVTSPQPSIVTVNRMKHLNKLAMEKSQSEHFYQSCTVWYRNSFHRSWKHISSLFFPRRCPPDWACSLLQSPANNSFVIGSLKLVTVITLVMAAWSPSDSLKSYSITGELLSAYSIPGIVCNTWISSPLSSLVVLCRKYSCPY